MRDLSDIDVVVLTYKRDDRLKTASIRFAASAETNRA